MTAVQFQNITSGLWYSIHFDAGRLSSEEEKRFFIRRMQKLADDFPCAACKPHFKSYMAEKPFDHLKYEHCFHETVQFHNSVNARLGKPLFTFDQAVQLYFGEGCTEGPCMQPKPDRYRLTEA